MKRLEDFAEDINKCSKCGLCQSVCPVYKQTGNDCAVSRGKFVMLDGVLKGDLKLSRTINKYLDLCLKCGKCKEFCPSNIDVCRIFETAKYEYSKKHFNLFWLLESRYLFDNFLKISSLVQKLFGVNSVRKSGSIKLLYFRGCVNKVYPKVENALKKILSFYDVQLIEKDFACCGLPFLSCGNLERFEEVKKHNLQFLTDDYDYIITDCASCEDTLKTYMPEDKIINAADFVAKFPKKFIFKNPVTVTFHKPCHLKNIDFLSRILDMCENVNYIEMKDYGECCGFAGEFALKNPKISRAIGREKARNIIATGADYVLSLCPSCTLGLHQGFAANSNFRHPKVKNIIEFLALAEKII